MIVFSAEGARAAAKLKNTKIVVIATEDEAASVAASLPDAPIYSSELLLAGVMAQRLDLDQNTITVASEAGPRKRARR